MAIEVTAFVLSTAAARTRIVATRRPPLLVRRWWSPRSADRAVCYKNKMAKAPSKSASNGPGASGSGSGKKKVYLNQTDVPRHSLEEAMRVPRAISDEYGKQPTSPLDIAAALDVKPSSGGFRYLCGAAVAYGLTDGGPTVPQISLTDLGRRIVAPRKEGDDIAAMRQALLQPRVIQQFLARYDGSKLPTDRIGTNVLESMGVPADATARTFNLIVDEARRLGMLRTIKNDDYVQLDSAITAAPEEPEESHDEAPDDGGDVYAAGEEDAPQATSTQSGSFRAVQGFACKWREVRLVRMVEWEVVDVAHRRRCGFG